MYLKEEFKNGNVFGEIILDATATRNDREHAIILINYIHTLFIKRKDSSRRSILENETKEQESFKSFRYNLKRIRNVCFLGNERVKKDR